MTRLIVCALACVFLQMGVAQAAAPAGQTAAYAAALQATVRALDAAAAQQRNGARVPDVHVPPAPLPGPPRFSPSLDDWLQNGLTAAREEKHWRPRAQMLRAIASTLREGARSTTAAPSADPAHPIAPTLAAILAQAAYHEQESTTEAQLKKSWWQVFVQWLAGVIDRLFSGLFSAASGLPWLGQVIIYVTLAALVILIIYVATRFARYLLAARRDQQGEDAGDLLEQHAGADELRDAAREAAARGQYSRAISLLFRAALRRLDTNGVIAYDAARTAGEYRRAVRRACAGAAPPFDALAQTFTLATYAQRPVGEDDWRAAGDAYGSFEPAVAQRAQRAAA